MLNLIYGDDRQAEHVGSGGKSPQKMEISIRDFCFGVIVPIEVRQSVGALQITHSVEHLMQNVAAWLIAWLIAWLAA